MNSKQTDGDNDGGAADGEAQEEEQSSSSPSELEAFRLQWKREIEAPDRKDHIPLEEDSIEERARWLFLRGVQAERLGKLQDAISLYRRAIQLVPDIEFRIDENTGDNIDDYFESEESSEESDIDENLEIENRLVEKFQKMCATAGSTNICLPKFDQMVSHISSLPPEVFIYILKWVVSQDLDVLSLEQVAKVCRGFYICARDTELWRLICLRTWDVNENSNRYGSWRNMYLQRPRVCFNGVYISKTTYVRYGESSFQDTNYRPCYLVEYYRYLRFFNDGMVLMLTTPDDPYQSVYQLSRSGKNSKQQANVMIGRYKIVGSHVMAVVKKEKVEGVTAFYRNIRRGQRPPHETPDQTFHLELEIKNVKKRPNFQLSWKCYSIHNVYRNGEESVSNFDIVQSKFPSFWFSRVKSFTAQSENPLG